MATLLHERQSTLNDALWAVAMDRQYDPKMRLVAMQRWLRQIAMQQTGCDEDYFQLVYIVKTAIDAKLNSDHPNDCPQMA
jgi:hypothetical protein